MSYRPSLTGFTGCSPQRLSPSLPVVPLTHAEPAWYYSCLRTTSYHTITPFQLPSGHRLSGGV